MNYSFIQFHLCHMIKKRKKVFPSVDTFSHVLAKVVVSLPASVTRKKSPNVYKSCPIMISLEK